MEPCNSTNPAQLFGVNPSGDAILPFNATDGCVGYPIVAADGFGMNNLAWSVPCSSLTPDAHALHAPYGVGHITDRAQMCITVEPGCGTMNLLESGCAVFPTTCIVSGMIWTQEAGINWQLVSELSHIVFYTPPGTGNETLADIGADLADRIENATVPENVTEAIGNLSNSTGNETVAALAEAAAVVPLSKLTSPTPTTSTPTMPPTFAPTPPPTFTPTMHPTAFPTAAPTAAPTVDPMTFVEYESAPTTSSTPAVVASSPSTTAGNDDDDDSSGGYLIYVIVLLLLMCCVAVTVCAYYFFEGHPMLKGRTKAKAKASNARRGVLAASSGQEGDADLFSRIDVDHDGVVSKEEFVRFYTSPEASSSRAISPQGQGLYDSSTNRPAMPPAAMSHPYGYAAVPNPQPCRSPLIQPGQ